MTRRQLTTDERARKDEYLRRLSARIEKLILRDFKSIREFEIHAGLHPGAIREMGNRRRDITSQKLLAIARGLGVSVGDLYRDVEAAHLSPPDDGGNGAGSVPPKAASRNDAAALRDALLMAVKLRRSCAAEVADETIVELVEMAFANGSQNQQVLEIILSILKHKQC